MGLDHEAIRKAYPNAVTINDGTGAFDEKGNSISLEQSKIDAARTAIDKEFTDTKYQRDRTTDGSTIYASVGDQLDLLWHAIDADADLKSKFSAFYNSIKAVKDANPKP
tara:strand:+ start:511 stop:837 length:327 start_codon:yes stop_codon:yes gene_type:complete